MQTRETVLQAARELGYEANPFAQGLRGKCNDEIGLFTLDLDLGVGTRKLQLIQFMLGEHGYTVPVFAYGYRHGYKEGQQAQLMRSLCRQGPRAIVCHTTGLLPEAVAELRRYQQQGGQVICDCYGAPLDLVCDQVVFDEEDNTYQAARHLLEMGHRKIGLFITGQKEPGGPRRRGFERALQEFSTPLQEEWLFSSALCGDAEEDGADAARQFLALQNRPTAVCIVNDASALAFISEVQESGLCVPRDLSVIGHDDRPIARYGVVPLTTVSHPLAASASQIVELLLARITSSEVTPPQTVWVRGALQVRRSTAPPGMR